MNKEQLKKLRDRDSLKLFDKKNKLFVRIQLNKKEAFICWERWVSKDKSNWVNWNLCLSLKDVANVLNDIKEGNKFAKAMQWV
jgi:hypothetical protein